MGGLIKKDLVTKTGNPARYELTDSGRDLAIRLELAEVEFDKSSDSKRNEKKTSDRKQDYPCETASSSSNVNVCNNVRRRVPAAPTILQIPKARNLDDEVVPLDDVIQVEDDEFDRYSLANPQPVTEDKNLQSEVAFQPQEQFRDVEVGLEDEVYNEDLSHDRFALAPDEYDIFLCVDHAEVSGLVSI